MRMFTKIMYFLLASCPSLASPSNGMITCSLEDDNPRETCTITCDNGYQLMGSDTRTCGDDGNWSGNIATCISEQLLIYMFIT